MDDINKLREKVMEKIDVSTEISDDRVKEIVDEVILEYGNEKGLSVREKYRLQKEIYDSIRGLDILEELLEDKNITEIMINGPDNIFIEKDGRIEKYNNRFSSKEKLVDIIQQIVSGVNRRVNESSPIVDSRLSDGSRVNVVLNPVAINGPVVTIRKFPEYSITMKKLIEIGSISLNVADFLKLLVNAKYNIFISGGTGSGKTTFLNVLSNYIPGDERIITIEDSAELQIQSVDNLVRMEVRQANDEGENGIDIRALIKSSLRMRPDRIIVGEVRGAEALDMLQAMNTGHDGSLSTGHGNSPKDMLNRLETMVLMGVDMPLKAIKSQIASGIDIIVHLGRLRDRTRKVLEIVEITGFNGEEILTNTIYRFEEDNIEGTNKGIVKGKLKWTGNTLINQKKLFDAGYGKEDISYGE
ncbi:Pertussis toxin liberation protein H [uncultured Eubacterium sp.]|nr:Pertussis toxin liberation protein H [uncultured Eubacterium sp.]